MDTKYLSSIASRLSSAYSYFKSGLTSTKERGDDIYRGFADGLKSRLLLAAHNARNQPISLTLAKGAYAVRMAVPALIFTGVAYELTTDAFGLEGVLDGLNPVGTVAAAAEGPNEGEAMFVIRNIPERFDTIDVESTIFPPGDIQHIGLQQRALHGEGEVVFLIKNYRGDMHDGTPIEQYRFVLVDRFEGGHEYIATTVFDDEIPDNGIVVLDVDNCVPIKTYVEHPDSDFICDGPVKYEWYPGVKESLESANETISGAQDAMQGANETIRATEETINGARDTSSSYTTGAGSTVESTSWVKPTVAGAVAGGTTGGIIGYSAGKRQAGKVKK